MTAIGHSVARFMLERVACDDEGHLRLCRVEIDRGLPVAQRLGIMGIPTILL